MSNQTWTYVAVGTAAGFSLIVWVGLVLVPAWTSFSRVWERLVATVLSSTCWRRSCSPACCSAPVLPLVFRRALTSSPSRRPAPKSGQRMAPSPAETVEAAIDLGALEAGRVTVAVEAGDGLPEVVRAARGRSTPR